MNLEKPDFSRIVQVRRVDGVQKRLHSARLTAHPVLDSTPRPPKAQTRIRRGFRNRQSPLYNTASRPQAAIQTGLEPPQNRHRQFIHGPRRHSEGDDS
jgi:hypothetical protein